jgi:hypothetical protein
MLKDMNISITHVLWHQGETDAILNTTIEQYYNEFMKIKNTLRKYTEAPIFVARASRCGNSFSNDILIAQNKLAEENDDIFNGPNTDLLGYEYRQSDNCHFTYYGAMAHSDLWLEVLEDYEN